MFTSPCSHEPDVIAALSTGRWSPELRAHADRCAHCREALAVAGLLRDMAGDEAERVRVPNPGAIWWKAQLLQRWDAEVEATRPVEAMQRLEIGTALAGAVGLAVWQWPAIVSLLEATQSATAAVPSGQTAIMSMFAIGTVLLVATLVMLVVTLMPGRD